MLAILILREEKGEVNRVGTTLIVCGRSGTVILHNRCMVYLGRVLWFLTHPFGNLGKGEELKMKIVEGNCSDMILANYNNLGHY